LAPASRIIAQRGIRTVHDPESIVNGFQILSAHDEVHLIFAYTDVDPVSGAT